MCHQVFKFIMSRDTEKGILYFAYGSNLAPRRLIERDVAAQRVAVAAAMDHRLEFNKRSERYGVAANLVPNPGETAWGVLYDVEADALARLDAHENVHIGHYVRHSITVRAEGMEETLAHAYVAADAFVAPPGRPHDEYLDYLLEGARHHRLPEDHIARLHALRYGN